jgi:hypothetical protein
MQKRLRAFLALSTVTQSRLVGRLSVWMQSMQLNLRSLVQRQTVANGNAVKPLQSD